MLQYILECIAFQLVFLIIYDVFLKRETFFQWNRLYLIGTYTLSMVLPWVKIEAMKTTVPESFQAYPEFLWNMNDAVLVANTTAKTSFDISWEYALLFGGMLLAALFFSYKLYQIYALKQKGEVHYFKDFTRVVIANSSIAFSFFKSIFLGDKVIERDHQNIVQHELVHIRQRHSYDLIFFELMRIVAWFNPLVYVYQNRVSELHEFIADAHVAKTNKKEQYQLLLSVVFQTQHISFINHFFKSSLIKKRIVMLQKKKSKQVFKLKYVLLLPLVLGMLMYTSCELESKESDSNDIESVKLEIEENIWDEIEKETVPFAVVDEVPVFPGCEDDIDPRACFNTMMQKHISKNFRYPLEAQEKGIQGRVSVMFVVAKDGSIEGLRMRGPDKLLEDEVERIINRLPKMQPGKADGVAVNVPFSIPVSFRLQDSDFNGFSENSDTENLFDKGLVLIDGKESSKEEMLELLTFLSTEKDNLKVLKINVLKAEEAIKKYGSKGKNGVIEIITKKKD